MILRDYRHRPRGWNLIAHEEQPVQGQVNADQHHILGVIDPTDEPVKLMFTRIGGCSVVKECSDCCRQEQQKAEAVSPRLGRCYRCRYQLPSEYNETVVTAPAVTQLNLHFVGKASR